MRRFIPGIALLVVLAAASAHAAPPDAPAPLPPLPAPAPATAPAPAPATAPATAPAPAPPSSPDVVVLQAPPLATHDAPTIDNSPPPRRHFYESGWFWGALGAAAFAGGAIYLATRDSSSPTIHLQVQVPH